MSFQDDTLDFEVDLTDLETFGESTSVKTPKMQKEQDAAFNSKKVTSSTLGKSRKKNEHLVNTSRSSQEDMDTSLPTQPAVSETSRQDTKKRRLDSDQESEKDQECTGDSDDEKLVIDDSPLSPTLSETKSQNMEPPHTPVSVSAPVSSESPSPQRVTRQSRRAKASGDQLSEILRMQTAMFNSAHDAAKSSAVSNSPSRSVAPPVHSHPTSLVKPCVSSYLGRNQNKDEEALGMPHGSTSVVTATESKS